MVFKVVKMAKILIINSLYVKEEEKLSAETFRPEYVKILSKLRKLKNVIKFGELISKIVNGDEIRTFVKDGLPYIRVSDMNMFFVETRNIVKIPKNSKIKKNIKLSEGDILISRSGTIGVAAIVTHDIKDAVISSDIIRIALKSKNQLNPYYLSAFLNSKYGYYQILQKSYGGVIPKISQKGLKEIFIYLPPKDFQLYIERLVKQAYEKRKLSEQKYQQAEEKLYELLGISKEEVERLEVERTYEANFKEVREAFRFDAEYYHPKYTKIVELLKKSPFKIKTIKEVVKISNEKIDPTKDPYRTKKFRYVPIAKINESGEIFEWEEFYGWQAPSRARMVVRKGDILVPSLSGTFDKIALVPEELDNQLTTTGCFVVRAVKDYPEFLFLLLRSPLVKRQLERLTTGAIMSAVPKKVFGDLFIPDIPKESQQEIATLIKEYFELRKEARQLIQKAIRKVEEAIENASRFSRK